MSDTDLPVIVVGAGPVGLVTALAFARAGVPVVVLEAEGDEVRAEWRGSTMHPPTLEMLERMGVAEAVLAGGVRVDRLQFRDLELPETATFEYSALAGHTRYPFRVQYEQYKLLRLLRKTALDSSAIDLRFGCRVLSLSQDDDTVTVTAGDGSRERLRARWVIGADGAHSTVRKLAGVGFPGDTHPAMSLVAATRFEFRDAVADLAPVSYWSGPAGRLSLIRTPDVWRVAVTVPGAPDAGAPPEHGPHPALASALDLLVGDRAWAATPLEQHQMYRSHQRVADRFTAGRVLLVGDAAHLSSTTGGMGLNSGVHDAFDLTERLAPPLLAADAAAERRAAAEYADVRRRAAMEIVQPATKTARAAVDTTDRVHRRDRIAGLRGTAADPAESVRHLRRMSMLDSLPVHDPEKDRAAS